MGTTLVAIDGSEAAQRVLDHAVRQASARPGVRLHVLTVQPPVRVYGEIEVYAGEQRMREMAQQEARAVLETARERVAGTAVEMDFECVEGEPGDTIVRRATELGCDGIVMGTHGRSRLGTAIMGSVAQRVVHLADVPVTLVK
jgi:nucleotide-binding universal stress UspA family protein